MWSLRRRLVVGNEHVAHGVDGSVERILELPVTGAPSTPAAEKRSARVEDLDETVAAIGDVDARRPVGSGADAESPRATHVPLPQIVAVSVEDLDTVIEGLDHVQVALAVDGQTLRVVELAGCATLAAPAEQIISDFGLEGQRQRETRQASNRERFADTHGFLLARRNEGSH